MENLESTLDGLWKFAVELCDEIRHYPPDAIVALMHSGWIPVFCGKVLWEMTSNIPFPPIVRTNFGAEKARIFDETKNPYQVWTQFLGWHEPEESIAYHLTWVANQSMWVDELKAQFHEQVGARKPVRILIGDDFTFEGKSVLALTGLISALYPAAEVRCMDAKMDWKNGLLREWISDQHPEFYETEIFGAPESGGYYNDLTQHAIQMTLGTQDIDPISLRWQSIPKDGETLLALSEHLPVEEWLKLPQYVEQKIRENFIARAGEYVPAEKPKKRSFLQVKQEARIIREFFRHGAVNLRHYCRVFEWTPAQGRRILQHMVEEDYLIIEKRGGENYYLLSPSKSNEYWEKRPLMDIYWAIPGKLMVGEFPGFTGGDNERECVDWALEQGVTFFLDLANIDDYKPEDLYGRVLPAAAAEKGIQIERRLISTYPKRLPKPSQISMILDVIDDAIQRGHVVYVHDMNTREVSELIAGCYLVRAGQTGAQALELLATSRATTFANWKHSPATERARKVVRDWKE